jgi:hypothetical protein
MGDDHDRLAPRAHPVEDPEHLEARLRVGIAACELGKDELTLDVVGKLIALEKLPGSRGPERG